MTIPLLSDLVVLLGLSLVVVLFFHRARFPVILGFLLTGTLAGPHGLGIIRAIHEVEILAEIGVILLLFSIGIEFSLRNLIRVWRLLVFGGALQVGLTASVIYVVAVALQQPLQEAVFLGLLVSLSSTALVLKTLQERAEIDTPHGRTGLAILIFQDLAIVPMMLFTPLLAAGPQDWGGSLIPLLGKGLAVIGLVVVVARWLVPWLLFHVARTRSREIFLLTTLALGLAAAWLTSLAGLSLALGAFLAGLVLSESEYSAQALGELSPFKDLLISFFFISIGMLLDISFVLEFPPLVVATTILVLGVKGGLAALVAVVLRLPLRTAILTGLILSQVGEFSFILSRVGLEHGLLSGDRHQLFLAVSVLTMAITPFLMASAHPLADRILRFPFPRWLAEGRNEDPALVGGWTTQAMSDHLIVVGYGVNGRNLARAAHAAGIPYVVLELNPVVVRKARDAGEPIVVGDAVHAAVLRRVRVERARVLVTAIADPAGTRRITAVARRLNPGILIVARTRYVEEVQALYTAGADHVIPEEFETSVELAARVLRSYLIPQDQVEQFIAELRMGAYEMFRSLAAEVRSTDAVRLRFPESKVATVRVSDQSTLAGLSLRETALRSEYGVTLLAILRDGRPLTNPSADTEIRSADCLIVFGGPREVANAAALARGVDD